jgi:hypothetical protein
VLVLEVNRSLGGGIAGADERPLQNLGDQALAGV